MKRSGFKRKTKRPPARDPHRRHRDSGTRSAVKKGPWRSEKYKRWVKENHGCLICGGEAHDAHHIRESLDRTMGVRKGDMWVVPLCAPHHAELHAEPRIFWRWHGINPVTWCREQFAQWQKETGI